MKRKRIINRLLLGILLAVIGYIVYYCWGGFQVISGYSAKNACSCAFIQGRTQESIEKEELGEFPVSLGSIEINTNDSSVTATVFGLAKRKAIYRSGFGCTVVNEVPEASLRAQRFPMHFSANDDIASNLLTSADTTSVFPFDRTRLDSAVSYLFQPRDGKNIYTRAGR